MNGAHDLGGMHGFGPVRIDPGEPPFHEGWERRVFALTLAAGYLRRWNLDETRFAREQMPPAAYLATTYYEHWLFGLEHQLDATRLVSHEELAARVGGETASAAPAPEARVLRREDVDRTLRNPRASRSDVDVPPRYHVGDAVITRNDHPIGHTRLPRYARGRRGTIAIDHGVWVFPDASGSGRGPSPQHCYTVRFTARELWGAQASPVDAVHVDLWDDHLEPA